MPEAPLWRLPRDATDASEVQRSKSGHASLLAWRAGVVNPDLCAGWVRVEPSSGEGSLAEISGQGRSLRVGRSLRPQRRGARG